MTETADIELPAEAVRDDDAPEAAATAAALVPVPQQRSAVALRDELSVDEMVAQSEKIEALMARAMREDIHYGKIPGIAKPTLLKPGAEKLGVLFRLAPTYPPQRMQVTRYEDGHMDVMATCVLRHIPTGLVVAEGMGMCSTHEQKYGERNAKRKCPMCGQETIVRSKYPPRGSAAGTPGGWWCAPRDGGCGEDFQHDDARIAGQEAGKTTNPYLADQYNTVLKMACKRAHIAAMLSGTAASDVFTQDVEDTPDAGDGTPFAGGAADGTEQATQPAAQPAAQQQAQPAQAATGLQLANDEFGYKDDSGVHVAKKPGATLAELEQRWPGWRWPELFVSAVQLGYEVSVENFKDLPVATQVPAAQALRDVLEYLVSQAHPDLGPSREQVHDAIKQAYDVSIAVVPPPPATPTTAAPAPTEASAPPLAPEEKAEAQAEVATLQEQGTLVPASAVQPPEAPAAAATSPPAPAAPAAPPREEEQVAQVCTNVECEMVGVPQAHGQTECMHCGKPLEDDIPF